MMYTRERLIEIIWRDVKTNGYGPRERAGHVIDRLVEFEALGVRDREGQPYADDEFCRPKQPPRPSSDSLSDAVHERMRQEGSNRIPKAES